jgi:hypothetical protein
MSAAASPPTPRTSTRGSVAAILVTLAAVVLLVACSANPTGGAGGAKLLHYARVWPDGNTEQQTIYTDGRIEMKHGEVLERLTIPTADVARIQDGLKAPIPTGSPDDSPKRTLELADGTVIEAPKPVPGSVTELLENLLNTHTLG